MSKNGTYIRYGDVTVGAKENFVPTITDVEHFVDITILQKSNASFENYGNPCEPYSVLLDASSRPIPNSEKISEIGIWSASLSGEDGYFENPISLSLKSEAIFGSSGITIIFDTSNNVYATEVGISWLKGGIEIENQTFYPDGADYFFSKSVEEYDQIEILFYRINLPYNRLKMKSIEYGRGIIFSGEELKKIKITQEIDPVSSAIYPNILDFTLSTNRGSEINFKEKQPISVYFNGRLQTFCFIKNVRRKSEKVFDISAEDYISLMEGTAFHGDIYNNKNAYDLFVEICEAANIPYFIDDSFNSVVVSGYLPYSNCRDAISQLAFAANAIVGTSGSSVVNVKPFSKELSQQIEPSRIMSAQRSYDEESVTTVEVSSHFYVITGEEVILYQAEDGGAGENIRVLFSEPIYQLQITNGEIIESGTNYADINAYNGCVLRGKRYKDIITVKRKKDEKSVNGESVVYVKNATLVTPLNIDKVLDVCYNNFVNSRNINLKIIDGKHVIEGGSIMYGQKKYGDFKYGDFNPNFVTYDEPTIVGDFVKSNIKGFGEFSARIIKQTFSLVGGKIVKDSILR